MARISEHMKNEQICSTGMLAEEEQAGGFRFFIPHQLTFCMLMYTT